MSLLSRSVTVGVVILVVSLVTYFAYDLTTTEHSQTITNTSANDQFNKSQVKSGEKSSTQDVESVLKEQNKFDDMVELNQPKLKVEKEKLVNEKKPANISFVDSLNEIAITPETKNIEKHISNEVQEPNDLELKRPEKLVPEKEEIVTDPCSSLVGPTFSIEPPSLRAEDGVIKFEGEEGFNYSINGGESFDDENIYQGLEPNKYHLIVEKEGCRIDLGIKELKEQSCTKEKSYIFESQFVEQLMIPIKEDRNTDIQIFTKKGNLVYLEQDNNRSEFIWDRMTLNGDLAQTGFYVIIIKAESLKSCKYSVIVTE